MANDPAIIPISVPTELKFERPTCGQHISATAAQSGVTTPCPNCNNAVTVPNASTLPPSLPPLAQSQSQSPPAATKTKSSRLAFVAGLVLTGIVLFVLFCMVAMKTCKEEEQLTRERMTTEQREIEEAIKQHRALIGMTAAQVRQAWGEPKRVIRTVDERHTYEEWIYGTNGSASLHFVDGVFKSGTRTDGK
jgi:hypothetical protein